MAASAHLELLRRTRSAVARSYELELADLDRRIKELETPATRTPRRGRPSLAVSETSQRAIREIIKVLQAADEPLSPRQLLDPRHNLGMSRPTLQRWLTIAIERGYIERVGHHGRYRVVKEVPPL